MPFQKEAFGNKATLAFFENLLPEGEILHQLSQSRNITRTFEFIKNFGKDCASAFTISAEETYKKYAKQPAQKIDLAILYDALDEKTSLAEVVVDQNLGYLSIAGAQDKFPCIYIYEGSEIFLPRDDSSTTHIVKAPI